MNQVCTRRWSRTLGCTGISLRGMAVVLVHLLPQFVKILIDGGGRGTSVNCYCSLWAPTVEGVLTIGTEETAELLIWHMRILAGLAHTPMSTSSISNFQFPPPPPPTSASSLSVFLAVSLNSIVIGCVSADVYIRSGLLPVYKLDRGKMSRAIFYQSELIH